jgi:hypothetical protein
MLLPFPSVTEFLSPLDFWNCTKRFSREECDYTITGLKRNLPDAFLHVTQYWVRKAFERADRYLTIYAMEKSAMPFKLREFMVKNWKRHRDVPTTLDELVDRTFDDLRDRKVDLTKRSLVNNIKPEK